ncbi:urease accessory protein UreE [Deinococcus altitudinis]|uniref:urease accessory protein UreE n=1 Tax=Deinococcus altitudinis TaxID=468914 RepID=UPI003891A10D
MKIANLRLPLTPAAPAEMDAPTVVPVPMTALDRRRVRRRLMAPDGTELRLAFPTGTYLAPGTLLERRGEVAYIVAAAAEDVAALRPTGTAQAVRAAHAIGNLHRDLTESEAGEYLALWDAPLELLLTRLGVPFTREFRPFLGRPSWADE